MRVGGVAYSQTPQQKNQITPKIAFFDPNFTFCSLKSHKNPGVGGWVHTFGIMLKNVSFTPSLSRNGKHTNYFQFSNDGW